MKTAWLALAIAATTPAVMAEVWVNPGFYSYHFQRDRGFNNVNTGLGFETVLTDTYSVTAGFFHNSDRETSRYVGVYAMPFKIGTFKAGAAVGAFDGYPKMREGGWFPAVIPTVAYEGPQFGLNVSVIPTVGEKLHGAVTFQFKYKLIP
ncbi:hypothetical protein [Limnohabitans sp.]|uniref:hypothetical protein n=1 Tax=Limnohabitans sp. TaxID=1907725 RepID=UPI00286F50EB|nr:hypothetical protein [Limnohabitans sp.]